MTRPDLMLRITPVHGLPEVAAGDDLAALIAGHADLESGDVVVVAQKVVSKAEGALAHPLPGEDPAAARRRLAREHAARVVADTFGRPWRMGQTDVAIGVAGLAPLRDERGGTDRHGARLEVTEVAVADELAAAADLVRRKADGVPVVVIRGFPWEPDDAATARPLVRPAEQDLFRRGSAPY